MQEGENEAGNGDKLKDKDGGRVIDAEVTRKDKDRVE